MSALSQALGAEAAPFTLTHKGTVYTLSRITQEKQTEYEMYLFGREQALAFSWCGKMSDAAYERHLMALNNAFIDGEFAFHSEKAVKAMKTPKGIQALLAILFGISEMEVAILVLERGPDIHVMLNLVIRECLPEPPPAKEGSGPNV